MKMDSHSVEYYRLQIVTDPPISSWEASFDDGQTFTAGQYDEVSNEWRWLVSGPDSAGGGASLPVGKVVPLIRAAVAPEMVVRSTPEIRVT